MKTPRTLTMPRHVPGAIFEAGLANRRTYQRKAVKPCLDTFV